MDKKRFFDSLTGLKGIFIYIIVLFHTLPDTPFINAIPMTSLIGIYGGTFGNYMFFMLSGFLMAYSYRKKIEKHEISLKAYLLRRLFKLYPLYLLSNMVMIVAEMV